MKTISNNEGEKNKNKNKNQCLPGNCKDLSLISSDKTTTLSKILNKQTLSKKPRTKEPTPTRATIKQTRETGKKYKPNSKGFHCVCFHWWTIYGYRVLIFANSSSRSAIAFLVEKWIILASLDFLAKSRLIWFATIWFEPRWELLDGASCSSEF